MYSCQIILSNSYIYVVSEQITKTFISYKIAFTINLNNIILMRLLFYVRCLVHYNIYWYHFCLSGFFENTKRTTRKKFFYELIKNIK